VLVSTYVAENETRLKRELEDKGLFLLAIESGGRLAIRSWRLPRRRRVPARDFIIFNQELGTLLKAGLPLVQSLDILRRRVPNPTFKASLDDVYERVRGGAALSEAFEAQGALFSRVYTASLMAGEKSGSLELVLRRYVQHMKVVASARGRAISALMYPIILVLLSTAVVGMIVVKVVPEFGKFYEQFGHGNDLPASTKFLVGLSGVLINDWWAIALGIGVVGGSIWFWLKQPGELDRFDGGLLRLPFVGMLLRKLATAQVARTIATLLSGGLPLVTALEIASRAITNRAVARDLVWIVQQVREGAGLGASLQKRGTFPGVAVEMVEVGEQTGALAEMLNSVADFYDEENEMSLDRFSNLVQPILLVVMGFIIAGLLLSLYMPLFQLSTLAG
jgi:type IV pilus assembly protein PilC